MKSPYVSELKDGQAVEGLFLVCEKEIRTSVRSNNSWLQLQLGDRTGSLSAKMWDNFAPLADIFEAGDVIRIRGRAIERARTDPTLLPNPKPTKKTASMSENV